MKARIYLENLTHKANVAYMIWTSCHLFKITPDKGFLRRGDHIYIDIEGENVTHNSAEYQKIFVKCLPLDNQLDSQIEEFEENLDEVFDEYNIGLLFTIYTLDISYDIQKLHEEIDFDFHTDRQEELEVL